MDLFKGFDCLTHALILAKLYTYGADVKNLEGHFQDYSNPFIIIIIIIIIIIHLFNVDKLKSTKNGKIVYLYKSVNISFLSTVIKQLSCGELK